MSKKSGQISTIIINSRKYTERTLSESEASKIPYIVAAAVDGDEGTVYGFHSIAEMKKWLDKWNLLDEYNRGESLIRRSKRRLTPDEEAEVRRLQRAAVNEATKRLSAAMSEQGIKAHETRKIQKLLTDYDPLRGPIVHSALLFEHCYAGGRMIVLPGAWSFPNFAWLNFDEIASSVKVVFSRVWLYEHAWYRGRLIMIFGYPYRYEQCFLNWPFYFNDMASSGMIL